MALTEAETLPPRSPSTSMAPQSIPQTSLTLQFGGIDFCLTPIAGYSTDRGSVSMGIKSEMAGRTGSGGGNEGLVVELSGFTGTLSVSLARKSDVVGSALATALSQGAEVVEEEEDPPAPLLSSPPSPAHAREPATRATPSPRPKNGGGCDPLCGCGRSCGCGCGCVLFCGFYPSFFRLIDFLVLTN